MHHLGFFSSFFFSLFSTGFLSWIETYIYIYMKRIENFISIFNSGSMKLNWSQLIKFLGVGVGRRGRAPSRVGDCGVAWWAEGLLLVVHGSITAFFPVFSDMKWLMIDMWDGRRMALDLEIKFSGSRLNCPLPSSPDSFLNWINVHWLFYMGGKKKEIFSHF